MIHIPFLEKKPGPGAVDKYMKTLSNEQRVKFMMTYAIVRKDEIPKSLIPKISLNEYNIYVLHSPQISSTDYITNILRITEPLANTQKSEWFMHLYKCNMVINEISHRKVYCGPDDLLGMFVMICYKRRISFPKKFPWELLCDSYDDITKNASEEVRSFAIKYFYINANIILIDMFREKHGDLITLSDNDIPNEITKIIYFSYCDWYPNLSVFNVGNTSKVKWERFKDQVIMRITDMIDSYYRLRDIGSYKYNQMIIEYTNEFLDELQKANMYYSQYDFWLFLMWREGCLATDNKKINRFFNIVNLLDGKKGLQMKLILAIYGIDEVYDRYYYIPYRLAMESQKILDTMAHRIELDLRLQNSANVSPIVFVHSPIWE